MGKHVPRLSKPQPTLQHGKRWRTTSRISVILRTHDRANNGEMPFRNNPRAYFLNKRGPFDAHETVLSTYHSAPVGRLCYKRFEVRFGRHQGR
jgi:hypothetical protein